MDNNKNEIEEVYKKMQEDAIKLNPNLPETIQTFNSYKTEIENYTDYLNLLNINPLPIASNQTQA